MENPRPSESGQIETLHDHPRARQLAAIPAAISRITRDFVLTIRSYQERKSARQYERHGNFWAAAYAYERIGNTAKAKEAWRKAAEQYQREGNFYSAGLSYERAGDPARAQKVFLTLAEQCEREGDFWNASILYARVGNTAKAEEMRLNIHGKAAADR